MKTNFLLFIFLLMSITLFAHDNADNPNKYTKDSLSKALADKDIPKIQAILPHVIDNLHSKFDKSLIIGTREILHEYYEKEPSENINKTTSLRPRSLFKDLLLNIFSKQERLRNQLNNKWWKEWLKRRKEAEKIAPSLEKLHNLLESTSQNNQMELMNNKIK